MSAELLARHRLWPHESRCDQCGEQRALKSHSCGGVPAWLCWPCDAECREIPA